MHKPFFKFSLPKGIVFPSFDLYGIRTDGILRSNPKLPVLGECEFESKDLSVSKYWWIQAAFLSGLLDPSDS
jgi:hypothetical protein